MRRARTTDSKRPPTVEFTGPPTVLDTGPHEYDADLGVYTFFFSVPRPETGYFKVVTESGDGYGVGRTMERFHDGNSERALVVILGMPGFLEPCAHMLARLCDETGAVQVASTPALRAALSEALPFPDEVQRSG